VDAERDPGRAIDESRFEEYALPMQNRGLVAGLLGVLLVVGISCAPPAAAAPPNTTVSSLPEPAVVAAGGEVGVEILSPAPGVMFTNQIFLLSTPPGLFIGTNREVGTLATLGEFPAGTELVLGIATPDGYTYVTGAVERNPDGVVHAIVEDDGAGSVTIRFEDLFGGGDLNYSDAVVRLTGATVR
jgi:hypothetical protein